MNSVREIQRLNEAELKAGTPLSASWHWGYRESSWVFVGGLAPTLTEGDVLCVFSQWGEVEDVQLVRDPDSGASKGFAYLKYVDFRSTVLAVDNMNGATLLGGTVRVDHKLGYAPPKAKKGSDAAAAAEAAGPDTLPGAAYRGRETANEYSLSAGQALFGLPSVPSLDEGEGGGVEWGGGAGAATDAGAGVVDEPREERKKHHHHRRHHRHHHRRSRSKSRSRSRSRGEGGRRHRERGREGSDR